MCWMNVLAEVRGWFAAILLSLALNVLGVAQGQSLECYFGVEFCENFCYDFLAGDQPKHPMEYISPMFLKM